MRTGVLLHVCCLGKEKHESLTFQQRGSSLTMSAEGNLGLGRLRQDRAGSGRTGQAQAEQGMAGEQSDKLNMICSTTQTSIPSNMQMT